MTAAKIKKLLLVGDSMIEFFAWQDRFPALEVLNLGRAGESVEELSARAALIGSQYQAPDLLLIMIGTNNVARGSRDFLASYERIIAILHESYPGAIIVVNSLLPMELPYLPPDTVARVNSALVLMAAGSGALYLDAWSVMADKSGQAREGILADEVHLSLYGYEIWSAEIERLLAKL
jgi:lysophospholipase L1-like esterase